MEEIMSKMTHVLLVAGVCLTLGLGCSDDTKQPQNDKGPTADLKVSKDTGPKTCSATSLLPADNTVSDYKKDTPQIATTAKELNDLIDGGSEKFSDNKFVCMAWVKYTSTTASSSVDVKLFDQTDAAAVQAVYGIVGTTYTDISPVIGDAAKESVLVSSYAAVMRKGKYIAQIEAKPKTAQADAVSLLKALAAALP
jgi:hypothetical protein